MRWFRLYSDLLHDPKVQRLSPALFKHWINLMCLANDSEPRGVLPPEQDIAFALRLRPYELRPVLAHLIHAGLLEPREDGRLAPHNWDERQRASDDVNERVRRHRLNLMPEPRREIGEKSAQNLAATRSVPLQTRRALTPTDATQPASILESRAIGNGTVTLHTTLLKRTVDTDTDTDLDTEQRDLSYDDVVGAHAPDGDGGTDATLSALCAALAKASGAELKAEALTRLIEQHPALDARRLVFETEMAADWIADPAKNKRSPKRVMSIRFLHNWYTRAEEDHRNGTGAAGSGPQAARTADAAAAAGANASGGRGRAGAGTAPAHTPDPTRHGIYAASIRRD